MPAFARHGLSDYFERVVVLNLARRPERMEQFRRGLGDWPFKMPARVEAVDGLTVPQPAGWTRGAGAWGCLLSHRAVLGSAIRDGVSSLLVLEDDALPVSDFSRRAAEFLGAAPRDWDCLMFGAQHVKPPRQLAPGVVRCAAATRTHAFALRGPLMRELLDWWNRTQNVHCDVVLAALMARFNAYAPHPPLIGQASGESDISGQVEGLRFLTAPDALRMHVCAAAGKATFIGLLEQIATRAVLRQVQ